MVNIFFIFASLPFLSPLPIDTDVQPFFLVLALLIIIRDLASDRLFYSRRIVALFLLSVAAAAISILDSDVQIQHRIGLLVALATYYIVVTKLPQLSGRALIYAVSINVIGVFWNVISPETFTTFAGSFVRVIKEQEVGYRGVSGFAAEPSFTAAVALTHALIAIYLKQIGKLKQRHMLLVLMTTLIVVLLTKAGLGFVYGAILILIYCVSVNWKAMVWGTVSLILLGVVIVNSSLMQSRGAQLVANIWSAPASLLSDGSVAERAFGIHVGVLSLINYPLGSGIGSYSEMAHSIDEDFGLQRTYPSARPQLEETSSSFGRLLVEFGMFFVIWLAIIVLPSFSRNALNISCVLLSSLFIATTFSIAFPPTYILLGIAYASKRNRCNHGSSRYPSPSLTAVARI